MGQINLFPVTALQESGGQARGQFEDTELAAPARKDGAASGWIAVRPEHMDINAIDAPAGSNSVAATVTTATYGGAHVDLALKTAGGTPIVMDVPAARFSDTIAPGAKVRVEWPIEKGFLLPGEGATAPASGQR